MEINENNKRANKLSFEKSPYLKQHQHNPVDWYPWGEEAFEIAKSEDKPIFLSIGYSTCHWCHVMEHESFSDPEVATMMNEVFVNIKVDREERPDIDHIYMTVCQMTTGSGGWPLTILMTPDAKPFFAGTYFPKEGRNNKPGIKDIIIRSKDVWSKFKNDISEQAEEITQQLNSVVYKSGVDTINQGVFRKGFYELASTFDELNGGFGNRPKFPIPHNFLFLLRYGTLNNSPESIDMVAKTLQSMRRGGIWDHVGFGFHRYSTDSEWLVPHFEKMLYDEALLSIAYIEAFQVTGEPIFKDTAQKVLEYIERDLQSDNGGFYSAEDADSEGVEGKFYVWNAKELRELLIGDVELFFNIFNISEKGNYFDEVTGKMTGNNILHIKKNMEQIAEEFGISTEQSQKRINSALAKLFENRKSRIRPHLDSKILTDWNGLVISAFSRAASVFGEPKYSIIAARAVKFIADNMINDDFSLNHRFAEGQAGINGMIDDYAYLSLSLLDYYNLTGDIEILNLAEKIVNKANEKFADSNGAYYFTASDGEKLIARKKEIYDGAMPSGNSIMLEVLLRLHSLTHKTEYFEQADKMVKLFSTPLNNVPSAYTFFLSALYRYFYGTIDVTFVYTNEDKDVETLKSKINSKFNPLVNLKLINTEIKKGYTNQTHLSLEKINDKLTCYVCSGFKCDEPIVGLENILSILPEKYNIKL